MDERNGAAAMLQCFARFFLEDLSRIGQSNVSGKAIEESSVQAVLHSANLPRQRGLRHMASLRGAREAALFGDGQEISQLPQLDLGLHPFNVRGRGRADYYLF